MIANLAGERVIFLLMRTKVQFSAYLLGAVLVCVPVPGWSQQPAPSQDSGVKHDMQATGHDTKVVAKDAGHEVKKGTTTAYDKTKHGTEKLFHKTKNATTGAANGAKEDAKQPDK